MDMHKTVASFFCAFVLTTSAQSQGQATSLPSVHVLATGGTIAGAQTKARSYDYTAGTYDVGALLKTVPDLEKLASVTGEQVANIGSYDMTGALWLRLGRRVNEVLNSPDTDAVLITHGTDTLEETAYFLSLVTKSDKAVVLVGSMRPATAVSPDGPANIYNGVAVATSADARGKGALVVLNDTIHYARNVTKTDTTGVQTFASLNRGPAGLVHTGAVNWFEPMDRKVGRASEFSLDGIDSLPRVDILYAYSDMNPDLVDAVVHGGSKGIVVAGMGSGSMPTPVLDALTKAAKGGVVVVRSTRVSSGVVLRKSNEVFNDDERGFVVSGELNPAKSRVLLQLALTKTKDPLRIQRMFYEY
jgi:L-asparaginase